MKSSMHGAVAAIFAYVLWGFFPVYFRQLASIAPIDIIAWRIVLSFVFLIFILLVWLRPAKLMRQLRAVNQWWLVLVSALLLSSNWLVFVYAVLSNQVLQSSLGYFLVPIVSVALGMLVLGERPNGYKRIAVGVAVVGMLITFIVAGQVPWIALFLGCSFGLYGLCRKQASYDSAVGLMIETALMLPIAVLYIVLFSAPIDSLEAGTEYWLLMLGLVTCAPLLTMIFAARRIELSSLGFYQYIAPVMHLLLAVLVYQESLDLERIMALVTTLIAVFFWVLGSIGGAGKWKRKPVIAV